MAPRKPPKTRPNVARGRTMRAVEDLTRDNDTAGVITHAAVLAQLPNWMRPYFRTWERTPGRGGSSSP